MIGWGAWLCLLRPISEVSIPRYCFWETETRGDESVSYQLHGFSDASNYALSCVVYLWRLIGRRSNIAFVHGKTKLILLSVVFLNIYNDNFPHNVLVQLTTIY